VKSVVEKVDMLGGFIRVVYRIMEIILKALKESKTFIKFLRDANLSMILIRVVGISVQVPSSPNNDSLILITGVAVLDDAINLLKT
jgi:hypothetical protein